MRIVIISFFIVVWVDSVGAGQSSSVSSGQPPVVSPHVIVKSGRNKLEVKNKLEGKGKLKCSAKTSGLFIDALKAGKLKVVSEDRFLLKSGALMHRRILEDSDGCRGSTTRLLGDYSPPDLHGKDVLKVLPPRK